MQRALESMLGGMRLFAISLCLLCACSEGEVEAGLSPQEQELQRRAQELESLVEQQQEQLDALATQRLELEEEPGQITVEYYEDSDQAKFRGFVLEGGVRTGKWTYWGEDGSKEREGFYANGVRNGPWSEFNRDGLEDVRRIYADGKELSRVQFEYWGDGSLLEEVPYVGGEREGAGKMYYESGQLQTIVEYKGDEWHGRYVEYREDGSLAVEGSLQNGERHGKWTEFHANGNKYQEATFQEGDVQGIWTFWYESGAKGSELSFLGSELIWTQKYWFENGQIAQEEKYENGDLVSLVGWTEDGGRDGHVAWTDCDGVYRAGQLVAGYRHGLWSYKGDGWEREAQWLEGVQNGPHAYYDLDEDGNRTLNKARSGFYENGKRVRDLQGAPNDINLAGLIVAKSVFDDGPTPSSMVLLRPRNLEGKDWTEEKVVAPAAAREFGLGTLADGSPVVCELGSDGEPASGAMKFVPAADGWTLEAADGEVTWSRNSQGKLSTKTYEMKGGNVFHKAMWWEPVYGEPGILTISANQPYLQVWRRGDKDWSVETLWTQIVGGKEQRFRDVEIGDVDGDGQDELVVVTHDLGAIYVIEQTEDGLVPAEVHRWDERIFAHECEIGDIDGDGKPEFFTTPSEPNRLDGEHQAGWIDMYRHNAETGEYERTNVAELTGRHAKEVMVADYDGDGKVELYAALEAEGTVDKVNAVRRWVWDGSAMVEDATIEIDGKMCRFLVMCDTTGDGVNEIVAATRKAGIFRLHMEDGEWVKKKIVMSYMSGGFEHATYAFDWDGDGKDELFVASDEQKKMNMFRHYETTDTYKPTGIASWKGSDYFVWNIMPLPAGN